MWPIRNSFKCILCTICHLNEWDNIPGTNKVVVVVVVFKNTRRENGDSPWFPLHYTKMLVSRILSLTISKCYYSNLRLQQLVLEKQRDTYQWHRCTEERTCKQQRISLLKQIVASVNNYKSRLYTLLVDPAVTMKFYMNYFIQLFASRLNSVPQRQVCTWHIAFIICSCVMGTMVKDRLQILGYI